MKKIIFTLLALVSTMSMNAQVMKIMKNGQDSPVKTYNGSDYYVVFEKAPATPFGQGEAEAKGIGKVKWIQLWENGPKFAEYNLGATSATDYGGYYTWGGKYKNGNGIIWQDDHNTANTGSGNLTGTDDTATDLWGSNWRMPTKGEFEALLNNENCTCTLTNNYNSTGINGLLCTGKGDYASNSVFFPAASYCNDEGEADGKGEYGYYWSSTPNYERSAHYLDIASFGLTVFTRDRDRGYSVRAVFNEAE